MKIGWAWTTLAFLLILVTQPAFVMTKKVSSSSSVSDGAAQQRVIRRLGQAILRYILATLAWYLTTSWFFGPSVIDRGFTLTGGKCDGGEGPLDGDLPFSATTCKSAGGTWKGGHDISGHVFMLVIATVFLSCEILGVSGTKDKVHEGGVEREGGQEENKLSVWSARFVWGVIGLSLWMLLMTSIFFHTFMEKV